MDNLNLFSSMARWIHFIMKDFTNLVQTRQNRRNEKFNDRVRDFNASVTRLFDIFCEDESSRKKLEDSYGVKMTSIEFEFLNHQKESRVMYCEDFVDRKWSKTIERRKNDIASMEKMRDLSETAKARLSEVTTIELSHSEDETMNSEIESCESDSTEDELPPPSKRKRRTSSYTQVSKPDDIMPQKYQHIRNSVRKVRPEVYETVDKLKSAFTCPKTKLRGSHNSW
ncbi:hypothetical protein ACF0H5_004894 [Mactra antiquata]